MLAGPLADDAARAQVCAGWHVDEIPTASGRDVDGILAELCVPHDQDRGLADLQREAGADHDLAGGGDVGELRLHLRALVFELEREDAFPRVLERLADQLDDALDDAQLGGGQHAGPSGYGVQSSDRKSVV